MAYSNRNAQQQGTTQSTALLARLQDTKMFQITPSVTASLVKQGLQETQLPILVSSCLAANIPPGILVYDHNIPQVVRAMKLMTQKGYIPGEDFYASVFDSDQFIPDENGIPTKEKVKAPTLVLMLSEGRWMENVTEHGHMEQMKYIVEVEIVESEEESSAAFDNHFKGTRGTAGAVVAVAYLSQYIKSPKGWLPAGTGKPQKFYGFFAPTKVYNGQTSTDFNEAGKIKPNYGADDIAKKRARVKAYRAVTKTLYPRDDRPADVRFAAMVQAASYRLESALEIASTGIDFDTAITDGDRILEQKSQAKRAERDRQLMADPDLDDFDRLMMYGENTEEEGDQDEPVNEEDGQFVETKPEDDESTDDPVAAADAIIAQWMEEENKPKAAQQWSVDIGAQPNDSAARNSMAKIVKDQFDGRLTEKNIEDVLREYYFCQQKELAKLLDTIPVDDDYDYGADEEAEA